jgi:hypothetical protein
MEPMAGKERGIPIFNKILGLCLVFVCSCAKEDFVLESTLVLLGQIEPKSVHEISVHAQNKNKQIPLDLQFISSCSCTIWQPTDTLLPPGEKRNFPVRFEASEQEGFFDQVITIAYTPAGAAPSSSPPQKSIHIQGEVVRTFTVNPHTILIKDQTKGLHQIVFGIESKREGKLQARPAELILDATTERAISDPKALVLQFPIQTPGADNQVTGILSVDTNKIVVFPFLAKIKGVVERDGQEFPFQIPMVIQEDDGIRFVSKPDMIKIPHTGSVDYTFLVKVPKETDLQSVFAAPESLLVSVGNTTFVPSSSGTQTIEIQLSLQNQRLDLQGIQSGELFFQFSNANAHKLTCFIMP